LQTLNNRTATQQKRKNESFFAFIYRCCILYCRMNYIDNSFLIKNYKEWIILCFYLSMLYIYCRMNYIDNSFLIKNYKEWNKETDGKCFKTWRLQNENRKIYIFGILLGSMCTTHHIRHSWHTVFFLIVLDSSKDLYDEVTGVLCFPGQHGAQTIKYLCFQWWTRLKKSKSFCQRTRSSPMKIVLT
jgi:hypothetical protein